MEQPLKVLVVDALETMRKVTAAQLASLGIEQVELARDGAEAMRLMQAGRFDIVISGWNMPVMSGTELLRAMRDDPRLDSTPFIMITAEAERSRIEEAIAQGVNDLLVKPYTTNRLALSIRRARSLRHPRRTNPPIPMPANDTGTPASPATAPAPPRLPPTLLLVDDTPDNLQLLGDIFKGAYRVRAAHHGRKALDICCSDQPPDLVLLDVMMPGMDGFEVARRMREHPNAENVPIIFVTALTGESARLQGMELGAVDFVTKPIDPVLLKLRVDNFMRYVELRRQLQSDYDRMLAMARLKEDVEAMTRHDMMRPLAGALGLVQASLRDDDILPRQAERLRLTEQTLLQVLDMVNLSTELYRIETGRFVLQPQPIAIGDLLRRIAEMARATFAGKKLVIAVDADVDVGQKSPQAAGDPMLTYSMLNNLVKNACEAAPMHSRVTINLIPARPLRIGIANRGAIPMEIRDRFFEKFVTWGRQGGDGLGAYSARLIAQAQHGDVSIAVSDEEDSTTVTVTLPCHPD